MVATAAAFLCLLCLMADAALLASELIPPTLPAPVAGMLSPSPYNFEFTGADNLRLSVANSLAGCVVEIHYRIARRNGDIVANVQTFFPTADRVLTRVDFNIGDGYLLNVTAFASNGAPKRGQTFIKLQVIHGAGAAATVLGTVLQGYVTATQDLGWPGSPIQTSTDGDGFTRYLTGTDPAPGFEIVETVPTNARWEVLAISMFLTTNATVADRRPGVAFTDSVNTYFRSPATATIPASTTTNSYWSQATPVNPAVRSDVPIAALPRGLRLLAGHQIIGATNLLQAGDDYAAPKLLVQEWLDI
jgi:hypothetical protein